MTTRFLYLLLAGSVYGQLYDIFGGSYQVKLDVVNPFLDGYSYAGSPNGLLSSAPTNNMINVVNMTQVPLTTQRYTASQVGTVTVQFPTGMYYKDVFLYCGGYRSSGEWKEWCNGYNTTSRTVFYTSMRLAYDTVFSVVCKDIGIVYSPNYNTVQIYSFTNSIWTTFSITDSARLTSAVCVDDSIIIFNGLLSLMYNITSNSYVTLSTPWTGVTGMSLAVMGRQVCVVYIF